MPKRVTGAQIDRLQSYLTPLVKSRFPREGKTQYAFCFDKVRHSIAMKLVCVIAVDRDPGNAALTMSSCRDRVSMMGEWQDAYIVAGLRKQQRTPFSGPREPRPLRSTSSLSGGKNVLTSLPGLSNRGEDEGGYLTAP